MRHKSLLSRRGEKPLAPLSLNPSSGSRDKDRHERQLSLSESWPERSPKPLRNAPRCRKNDLDRSGFCRHTGEIEKGSCLTFDGRALWPAGNPLAFDSS